MLSLTLEDTGGGLSRNTESHLYTDVDLLLTRHKSISKKFHAFSLYVGITSERKNKIHIVKCYAPDIEKIKNE